MVRESTRALIACALVACTSSQPTPAPAALSLITSACLAPLGAVPDDGVDDREPLQKALDAGGCVQLAAGRYDVSRRPALGVRNVASLQMKGATELRGAGQGATTLAMAGSGKLAELPADWILLSVTGEGGAVRDLTLDGSLRSDTGEQTHLLQVEGPSKRTMIERITTVLPDHGPQSGGDCIRLVGTFDARVQGTTIRDVQAPICDRSWLGVQRGVVALLVERVRTFVVGDQAIDFEPTGSKAFNCTPIVDGARFIGLDLARGPMAQGPYTMTVAGEGCAYARSIQVTDARIRDGGIFVHRVDRVTFRRVELQ